MYINIHSVRTYYKMSSFIIQLLIISVVGLMVQSAPVSITDGHLHKRSINESEKSLFCAATSLHFDNDIEDLLSNLALPAAPQININTKTVINAIFHHFSTLCKDFTKAMSLKYQVQDLLFNADTTPELTTENIQTLTKMIIKLQTMATALGDLQFHEDRSRCVRLTAAQYRIMYHVSQLKATLKQTLEDITKSWVLIGNYQSTNLHPREC